jgi:hypothetical protein
VRYGFAASIRWTSQWISLLIVRATTSVLPTFRSIRRP